MKLPINSHNFVNEKLNLKILLKDITDSYELRIIEFLNLIT